MQRLPRSARWGLGLAVLVPVGVPVVLAVLAALPVVLVGSTDPADRAVLAVPEEGHLQVEDTDQAHLRKHRQEGDTGYLRTEAAHRTAAGHHIVVTEHHTAREGHHQDSMTWRR